MQRNLLKIIWYIYAPNSGYPRLDDEAASYSTCVIAECGAGSVTNLINILMNHFLGKSVGGGCCLPCFRLVCSLHARQTFQMSGTPLTTSMTGCRRWRRKSRRWTRTSTRLVKSVTRWVPMSPSLRTEPIEIETTCLQNSHAMIGWLYPNQCRK